MKVLLLNGINWQRMSPITPNYPYIYTYQLRDVASRYKHWEFLDIDKITWYASEDCLLWGAHELDICKLERYMLGIKNEPQN